MVLLAYIYDSTNWSYNKYLYRISSMDHFYEDIYGWFDYHNLYNFMVNEAAAGGHIVEVGTFKGRSAAYMAVNIANCGKKIRFDCVDTWLGSVEHHEGGPWRDQDVVEGKLFERFMENMRPIQGLGLLNPMRMTSLEAAAIYADNSLDAVFIDASHEYEDVKADIMAWFPKIKIGGILAGHDITCPTVKQAVEELLPSYQMIEGSCWAVRKAG
jgi:Methyltransferase domain